MISDIFDKHIVKVLTLFSISKGSRFTRNEIKEKTSLNNVPLDKTLNTLLKNNILRLEKRFYGLNFDNVNLNIVIEIIEKEYHRFKDLPLRIYYLLVDLSEFLSSLDVDDAYLFGSFAKLIHNEKSDVDIAIITDNKDLIAKIKKGINKTGKRYSKVIEEHFFEVSDLSKKDPIIGDIKRNGIKLF